MNVFESCEKKVDVGILDLMDEKLMLMWICWTLWTEISKSNLLAKTPFRSMSGRNSKDNGAENFEFSD